MHNKQMPAAFDNDPSVQRAAASLHDLWYKMQRSGPLSLNTPGPSDATKLVNPSEASSNSDAAASQAAAVHRSKQAQDNAPVALPPAVEAAAMQYRAQKDTAGSVWRPWAVY
jgi:hypothetical protein